MSRIKKIQEVLGYTNKVNEDKGALIYLIKKYDYTLIVDVIKALGEEQIAGMNGVRTDDIDDVLDMADEFELRDILHYLKKKNEKNEDYGWEIIRGKEFEAFEEYVELVGEKHALDSIVRAMGTEELGNTLAFIFRNEDFNNSSYLVNDDSDEEDDYDESKKN